MVSVKTLKTKSVNSLENLLASNEEKVKLLLEEIEDIKSVLAEKTQNDVVKGGIYFVDGKQDIIVSVIDGMIDEVFSADKKLHIRRPISIRFEKNEMVCQLKGKKHKLNFMFRDPKNKYYNGYVYELLATASVNINIIDTLLENFDKFLNDKTKNQELFKQALAIINNELHSNYTFNKDFLSKFLNGHFIKQLIDTCGVTYKTVDNVLTLIASINDYKYSEYYLINIVKKSKVNL